MTTGLTMMWGERRPKARGWGIVATALVLLSSSVAKADPGADCLAEMAVAEQVAGIPPGLMAAVARAETGGSPYAAPGEPWPWALNIGGVGRFLPTERDAATLLAEAQAAYPTTNIDVGCMQISLKYHPDAFATPADGLDPVTNVRYAARFLKTLWAQSGGSWETAVGRYHSGTPELAAIYRDRVLAYWHGTLPVTVAPAFMTVAGTSVRFNARLMPGAKVIHVGPRTAAGKIPDIISPE